MKSRRKGPVRLLAALFVLTALGAVYLKIGVFPGRFREEAMLRIFEWTHKRVVFDKVLFIPFHGVSFYNVGVFEDTGEPIFTARRITLNARLAPFFKDKKIVVNRFLLEEPVYDWIPQDGPSKKPQKIHKTVISGQIEVPTAQDPRPVTLRDAANGPDYFLPENVYIERIEVSNGRVTIRKDRGSAPVETLRSVNLRMTLPQGPLLRFDGRVELGENSYASVDLKGVWDLEQSRYEFTLRTQTSRIPDWLLEYQKNHFLVLREGRVSLETRLLSGKYAAVLFKTKASLQDALLTLEPARYSGQMRLEAEGVFDGLNKRFKNYRGELTLVKVKAENLSPKIKELNDLAGTLHFEPDNLLIRSLRGIYKNVAFDASGTIHSFKELLVNGQIRSHLTMDQIRALLEPAHAQKLKDFIITGECQALTTLEGSLRKGSHMEMAHKIIVQNASVRNDAKKIRLTELYGEISSDQDGLRIQKARFLAGGKPVSLDAVIPKKIGSLGNIRLSSAGLEVRSDYTLRGEDLDLENGQAVFSGGRAAFSGKCVRWTDPWLELQGEAHLDLGQLPQTVPLSGILSGPFVLSGVWDKPLDWDLKMDAQGAPVYLQNSFRVDKLEIQVRMKNKRLAIPHLHATGYGGTVGSQIEVELSSPDQPFESQFYFNNLDLEKIRPDLTPPNKTLKGTLIGKLALAGRWKDPASYRGSGAVSVTNGFLGQTSEFKAMGHLPLLKVEGLDLVTFEEMSATFEVRDKKILTNDLTLMGDAVDLSLRGAILFDQSLDLLMSIRYSEAVLRGAALTGGFAPLVVQQAGNLISEYRVRGTLKKPVYEKMILPSGRTVGKKISGLLQGLAS